MIYVVMHGEYEDKEVTLVTQDLDKAIKHFIDYRQIPYTIEEWNNDIFVCSYGSLTTHLINRKEKKNITHEELKKDVLKVMKGGE